jgi:cell division transport system permease protein
MPYALREVLIAFRRAPLLTGLSATMIALSLLVVGLFGIAAYNVRLALERMESRVEVVAYLYDDAPTADVRAAIEQVMSYPEVREVDYISRDRALEIARQELREFQTVFAGLETNPLPASLNVMLRTQQDGVAGVRAVAERLALLAIVEEVVYGSEWLEKIFLLRRVAGAATLVLGLAFAMVAAIIIGSAVRMAIFARRDEITIMRLVGASEAFVRRPFLLEGLITGLAGAALALLATYGLYRVLADRLFDLAWMPTSWLLAGIAFGALIGTLASAIAVRRYAHTV